MEEADQDYYNYYQQYFEEESNIQEHETSPIQSIQALPDIIHKDVLDKQTICCMEYGPTLQLYSLAHFDSEQFNGLIDANQTGRRLVNYIEGFEIASNGGHCAICNNDCLVIQNSCGHTLCSSCWSSYISNRTQDFINPELFPRCPTKNCSFFVHYKILEVCWLLNPLLKTKFEKLLCIRYCIRSSIFKVCPNMGCGKIINTTHTRQSWITCECGRDLCVNCGKASHEPLRCWDIQKWNALVAQGQSYATLEEATQTQKAKYCPECLALCVKDIDDNSIETVCQCGCVFCWGCMESMEGHFGNYFCFKDANGEGMLTYLKKRPKLPHPTQTTRARLENIDTTIERILKIDIEKLRTKLLGFLLTENESNVLMEISNYIIEASELIKSCLIYTFLELENSHLLNKIIYHFTNSINLVANFIEDTLPKWLIQQDQVRNDYYRGMNSIENFRNWFLKQKGKVQEWMSSGRRMMKKVKEGRMADAFVADQMIE